MKILSGILLLLSGIAVTLASAYFGIKGLLLFFPQEELAGGILFLGIAFEAAKVFASVFLFHHMKDRKFPTLIKVYLTFAVATLIVIGAIATYVHLSVNIAEAIKTESTGQDVAVFSKEELSMVRSEMKMMNDQISQLPENYVTSRLKLMNEFKPRLQELAAREKVLIAEIRDSRATVTSATNDYAFIEYMGEIFGVDKATLYNYAVMLIVSVIDPLAITVTMSATYVLNTERIPSKIPGGKPSQSQQPIKPRVVPTETASVNVRREDKEKGVKKALKMPAKKVVKKS